MLVLRRCLAVLVVSAVLALPVSARAEAENPDYVPMVAAVAAILGTNTGLTVIARHLDSSQRRFRGYGAVEVMIAAPQAALFSYVALNLAADGETEGAVVMTAMALWTGGLTAHGLYTLFRAYPPQPAPAARRAALDWQVTPTLIGHQSAPGAAVFGTF